jgi:hypothetical protein
VPLEVVQSINHAEREFAANLLGAVVAYVIRD